MDEHEGGRDAIALAAQLLACDGELTLAHVYAGRPNIARVATPSSDASERRLACELLETARDEAGVQANLRWRGSPSVGRGVHELAEIISADLLVVGSSRRSLLGRVLVGDDTRAALNGAPCAIAIAPGGYAGERGVMRETGVGYDGSPQSEHALPADAVYQAGARGWLWIKLKREYRTELRDTFDLVVVGAFHGRGKRAGAYGALLRGAYDETDDTFRSFCRCGTGFTDADLAAMPKRLEPYRRSG